MFKTIEVVDVPQDVKDAIKELGDLLTNGATATEAYTEFKATVGRAMAKAIEIDDIDPRKVAQAMITLGAITINCYSQARDGMDQRKTFKKFAGDCWDRAKKIEAIADEKGE